MATLKTDREALLLAARWCVDEIKNLDEVIQVALIGSVCTNKPNPKDIDLLVTVRPGSDLTRLARLNRKTQGRIQQGLCSAEIFVAEDGRYVGRICRYREPWPRVICGNNKLVCDLHKEFLCNTSNNFTLSQSLIDTPPIILYPKFSASANVPDDVRQIFG